MNGDRPALPELPERIGPAIVVAVAAGGAIGRDGALPWRAPEDLAHFKRVTMGHVVVVGSTTWASIGRPLPGRDLVVVSSRSRHLPDGVTQAPDPDTALDLALARDPSPIIAGGARIYASLLPRAVRVFLTELDEIVVGADTMFPDLDERRWTEVAAWKGDDARLTFRVLDDRTGAEPASDQAGR